MANETRHETGVDLRDNKVINMATPVNPTDGANKAYADGLLGGGGLVDGGAPSTAMTGILKIDFGAVT